MSNSDFLIFFNAEKHGKRHRHPLKTTTRKGQQQNTDFLESKASFVIQEVKKTLVKMECRSE